ncbi:MAG: hypothetical protein M3P18_15935, partial [Actinomycetota bacterium]|nr:hypothetical protein [Actinomycetota bacterium]
GLEQDADTWKKRLRRGADVGGAIAFVKALLGGGGAAAVKVAATALAVAATTVAAATEVPRHAHHAQATKPAPVATRHLTRQSTPTIIAATTGSLAHRSSTRAVHLAGSSERSLPKPVVLPASHPDETSAPALAQPTSAPEAPPVLAPVASAPSVSVSAPAGNGKPDKADRTTQATTQLTETTPVPVADPPVQESDQGHGNGNDKDKSDNGNGNGNNASVNSSSNGDNPGKGNGKNK